MSSALPPTFTSAPLLYLTHMVTPYTEREIKGLERRKFFTATGAGYMQEQATKPQTLGYSLADSPAGILAWIYEKLIVWSDDYPWNDDEGAGSRCIVEEGGLKTQDSARMGLCVLVLSRRTRGLPTNLQGNDPQSTASRRIPR